MSWRPDTHHELFNVEKWDVGRHDVRVAWVQQNLSKEGDLCPYEASPVTGSSSSIGTAAKSYAFQVPSKSFGSARSAFVSSEVLSAGFLTSEATHWSTAHCSESPCQASRHNASRKTSISSSSSSTADKTKDEMSSYNAGPVQSPCCPGAFSHQDSTCSEDDANSNLVQSMQARHRQLVLGSKYRVAWHSGQKACRRWDRVRI